MVKYSELSWETVRAHLRTVTSDMEEAERFPTEALRVLARGVELVMERLEGAEGCVCKARSRLVRTD
jgi:exonuclease VII small subunit